MAAANSQSDMTQSADTRTWRDVHVSAQDGLRLHVRDYGERTAGRLPVVCLAGLTRNAADFHELAVRLSTDAKRPRRVVAPDYRGRGGSEHDRDWRNYTPVTEALDVLAVMAALGIGEAAFVGTSRGGLVVMVMAAMRPTAIHAAVLNDVGPELDGRGLIRIKNTLAATQTPRTWEAAAALMKQAYETTFPTIDDAGWMAHARRTYGEQDGRPVLAYDPKLLKGLAAIDFDRPLPAMWPQFDALAHAPVMAIRGAKSDLLSQATLEAMAARRPDMATLVIEDAGHAPMLTAAAETDAVAAFLAKAEG